MNNKQHTRIFARSDDALILEQPVTRIGLKRLATMLGISQEKVMRRAENSAFRWPSAMIMTGLSTRDPSVAASSTRYYNG